MDKRTLQPHSALHLSLLFSSPDVMSALALFSLPPSFLRPKPKHPRAAVRATHNQTGVVIIGGGLAGLAAATHLASANVPFLLLEASDDVGGRVRTDLVDGFLLDRGFQIFITAYPEARRLLDYPSLNLRKFYSGARVYYGGEFHTVADPLRHVSDSLKSLANPIGSLVDKVLIGLTRARSLTMSDDEIMTSDEVPVDQLLKGIGFSESIIKRFFRPFFGGIFFDPELGTSSRLFYFIFKCLALGDNTLPDRGIGAIPGQLARKLPPDSVMLNSRVVSVEQEARTVLLEDGVTIQAELGVIVAVEEPEVARILGGPVKKKPREGRSTVCLYFSVDANRVPVGEPVLFINGSGEGIVNNMFFATNVARSYGPPGKALVSVTLIGLFEDVGDDELAERVVRELSGWFGEDVVRLWSHLRTYRIRFAQPNQCPPTDLVKDPRLGPGLYVCGDHVTSATFDGALVSGRRAAECLLRDSVV